MEIIHLNKDNFESVTSTDKKILIDFWAPWCGPCRMLSPIIEEIAEMNLENVIVCKVNCDENDELCQAFRVNSIPALFVVQNKKVIKNAIGYRPKEEVLELLK